MILIKLQKLNLKDVALSTKLDLEYFLPFECEVNIILFDVLMDSFNY